MTSFAIDFHLHTEMVCNLPLEFIHRDEEEFEN